MTEEAESEIGDQGVRGKGGRGTKTGHTDGVTVASNYLKDKD